MHVLTSKYIMNTTKYMTHVGDFARSFKVQPNRLGNDALQYVGGVAEARLFLAEQTSRPGEGDQSSVDIELDAILAAYFSSKVNDLEPEENSDALLKRLNGWYKRPEKATTGAENAANKGQVKETNSLAEALSVAQTEHGVDSPEAKAAQEALVAYTLSQIGV